MRTDDPLRTHGPTPGPGLGRIADQRAGAADLVMVAFARVDAVALGCAFGVLFGLIVLVSTVILLLKGGDTVGPRLGLLAQYFVGYTVTPRGSLVGLLYGFGLGFGAGWLLASLRNLCVAVYLHAIRVRSQLSSIHDVLDPE